MSSYQDDRALKDELETQILEGRRRARSHMLTQRVQGSDSDGWRLTKIGAAIAGKTHPLGTMLHAYRYGHTTRMAALEWVDIRRHDGIIRAKYLWAAPGEGSDFERHGMNLAFTTLGLPYVYKEGGLIVPILDGIEHDLDTIIDTFGA